MRFSLETSRDLKDLIKKLSTGLKKLDFEITFFQIKFYNF